MIVLLLWSLVAMGSRLVSESATQGGRAQQVVAPPAERPDYEVPKIIYASRTHSQLKQVLLAQPPVLPPGLGANCRARSSWLVQLAGCTARCARCPVGFSSEVMKELKRTSYVQRVVRGLAARSSGTASCAASSKGHFAASCVVSGAASLRNEAHCRRIYQCG